MARPFLTWGRWRRGCGACQTPNQLLLRTLWRGTAAPYSWRGNNLGCSPAARVINACPNSTPGGRAGACEQAFLGKEGLPRGWRLEAGTPHRSFCLLPTGPEERSPLVNGEPRQHAMAPQKSLPDLPPPKTVSVGPRPLTSLPWAP